MKQRIYSYFLSIVLLVGCLLPAPQVRADDPPAGNEVGTDQTETDPAKDGADAIVTFTNAPDNTPYLEIQKELPVDENEVLPEGDPENEDEELRKGVKDTVFHFFVEVQDGNGIYRPHTNKYYSVTETGGGSAEDDIERFNTGSNGMVELKAGQTARFDYVGEGKKCRITEIDLEDGFACVSPAGGEVAVTIGANGATVIFQNKYSNVLDAEDGALTVQKKISYPQGYDYTGTEEFGFTLLVDNKPAKSENYTVKDLEAGADLPGVKKTDDNGHFTLKANEAAVFTELLGKRDYRVTEDACPENWHSVGKNSFEGSTSDHETVTFTNTNTAFTVEKRLVNWRDDTTQFTFELLDQEGRTWADAEYMLYSATSGERIDQDVSGNNIDGKDMIYKTGADGRFRLKANQAAVFIGIEEGTGYSVKEVAEGGEYVQQTPTGAEGYQNQTVSKAGNEILPFFNARLERKGAVTVTKQLKYASEGEAPLPGAEKEFRFRISRIDTVSGNNVPDTMEPEPVEPDTTEPGAGEPDIMEPGTNVPDTAEPGTGEQPPAGTETEKYFNKVTYTKGTGGTQYTTDDKGEFTLKAGETAIFEGQFFDRRYKVEEIGLEGMPGYSLEEEKRVKSGTLEDGQMLSFVFENTYTARHYDLEISKVDETKKDGEQALAGAKFMLYTDEACTLSYNGSKEPVATGADGKVTLTNLREGTYYLKEVVAPKGYQIRLEPIVLTVKRVADADGNEKLEVELPAESEGSEVISADWSGDTLTSADDPTTGHDKLTITIKNDRGKLYNLPATGGPGTAGFAVIGIILMAAAAALVIRSRKKTA